MSHFLYRNFNSSLSCSTFPTGMIHADVTPIHKKDVKIDKANHRPIRISSTHFSFYKQLHFWVQARVALFSKAFLSASKLLMSCLTNK